jgi:CTP synthase
MELELGQSNTLFVHVTLAPVLDVVGEQKTKPTQHSVQELRRIGIQPDILAVRSKMPLSGDARRKISLFASVSENCVISCHDAPSIYKVPEVLEEQGMLGAISGRLALRKSRPQWGNWKTISDSFLKCDGSTKIAVVGKYVTLPDSYVSIYHALSHAGASIGRKVKIYWIDSEKLENGASQNISILKNFEGILVPGGFGKRGSEGIINAANFARLNNIPYLGICFGFQLAIVAFARHNCKLMGANSTELDPSTKEPIVDFMPDQQDLHNTGGTMRLGSHEITIKPKTIAANIYGLPSIRRRHRHRFEFNQQYLDIVTKNGLTMSAHSDNGRRMEVLEIVDHKFYFALQYHAEFNSRPGKPEQAFEAFVKAAANYC